MTKIYNVNRRKSLQVSFRNIAMVILFAFCLFKTISVQAGPGVSNDRAVQIYNEELSGSMLVWGNDVVSTSDVEFAPIDIDGDGVLELYIHAGNNKHQNNTFYELWSIQNGVLCKDTSIPYYETPEYYSQYNEFILSHGTHKGYEFWTYWQYSGGYLYKYAGVMTNIETGLAAYSDGNGYEITEDDYYTSINTLENGVYDSKEIVFYENNASNRQSQLGITSSGGDIDIDINIHIHPDPSKPSPIPTPLPVPDQINVGDIVTFGSYEQDNNLANGQEAIEWQVLRVRGNEALLLSRYGLDAQPYHQNGTDVTWANSTLRSWLNGSFYQQAFSPRQASSIVTKTIENKNNSNYGTLGGVNTTDPVFLLSYDQVYYYLPSNEQRMCYPTEYAKARNVYVNRSRGTCWWWLRTPGFASYSAADVDSDGTVSDDDGSVAEPTGAVRPAIWVRIS
ncbi:MAG: DUF6273 domain-containing protein [Eubacteriales bacterium]|nr:DUF6273 domain-containing protein [Eubacteriales bacterium]